MARALYLVVLLGPLFVTGPAVGQDTPRRSGADLPPPTDQLFNQPPLMPGQGEMRGYWVAQCRRGEPACDDMLSRAAGQMWVKIRGCWQPPVRPPLKAVLSTAVRFGDNARSAPPLDRDKTVVSIAFQLDPNGKLMASPTANKADATAATPEMIGSVIAAVERCQPYEMLSGIRHDLWKDVFIRVGIEFTANPQVGQSKL